ncbi:Os07g0551501, partial [Oryza sativa Japonica Group]
MVLGILLWHRVQHFLAHRQLRCATGLSALRHTIVGETHHHHGAHTVVHAVIADASKPPLAGPPGGAEALAPHDDRAEPKPLHLEAEPLLHVVILDDVDLVGDPGVLERLGQVVGLGRGEGVEVVLHLAGRGLSVVLGRRRVAARVRVGGGEGEVDGAPVGAVEHGGGADVQQYNGVPGAEVVGDGPADGVRGLVGEVNGDGDAAVRGPDRGGRRGGREEHPRGLRLQRRRRGGARGRRLHRRRRRRQRQVNGVARRVLHR